jgi:hypothetical protein
MKIVNRLRAKASLCRQAAAFHPDRSWRLLADAEHLEHLAAIALSDHFKECTRANDPAQPQAPTSANNTAREAAAVA